MRQENEKETIREGRKGKRKTRRKKNNDFKSPSLPVLIIFMMKRNIPKLCKLEAML